MSISQPQEISPKNVKVRLDSEPSALLIDIRSGMEFLFVGHPKGAVNIAWIDEPDWVVNPNFTAEIRKLMLGGVSGKSSGEGVSIILICRSGKRSMEAGAQLLDDGLQNVYSVEGGFEGDLNDAHQRSVVNGWRFEGLPWAQC
ncbi:MAG: rhodanese-like domain-containing protein [Arenicellales bacterium]